MSNIPSKLTDEEKKQRQAAYQKTYRAEHREEIDQYRKERWQKRKHVATRIIEDNPNPWEHFKGMKFEDALKEIPDDQLMCVGAQSAWIWFGTKNGGLDDLMLRFELCKEDVMRLYLDNAKKLRNTRAAKQKYSSLAEHYQKALDNYKKPLQRTIRDAYWNIARDCLCIVVEGVESGRYWRYSEWMEVRNCM